ncbi:MAG: heavy-metal-associated domain-containing protein [Flavobacteriaceae bacterium]|nr:MAG: heavy-metal-associated domain-containing protein [Flavobacteriaceae bacterium]
MKLRKISTLLVLGLFLVLACKKESPQKVALHISGMTCEIGCAKLIQSKLSKKGGVKTAEVIFKDSIANVAFDANTISSKEIIAFIDDIADGESYKATEITLQETQE